MNAEGVGEQQNEDMPLQVGMAEDPEIFGISDPKDDSFDTGIAVIGAADTAEEDCSQSATLWSDENGRARVWIYAQILLASNKVKMKEPPEFSGVLFGGNNSCLCLYLVEKHSHSVVF